MRELFVRLPILIAVTAFVTPTPAAADSMPPSLGTSVTSLSQQLDQAQQQLAKLDDQVETARAQVDTYNRRLIADQAHAASLHRQLAAIARLQYQRPALSLTLILNAQSLDELLTSISQARLVADRQQKLLDEAHKLEQHDAWVRDQSAAQLASIQTSRDQASKMVSKIEAMVAAAQAAAAQAAAAQAAEQRQQAQMLAAQRQRAQMLAQEAKGIGTTSQTPGSYPNHFDPGQCTWYVASRRYVPWYGNANQWIAGAAQYGFAEGPTPKAGAIMVTAESSYGHVAYVESVNSDGSWTVSEMNYVGPYVVDRRTISPGQVPLISPGFIY
jgi:surface antigen